MNQSRFSGTEGYADEAEELFVRYERIPFTDSHEPLLHLIPEEPSDILDIGAGTGRDAGYLAGQGHRVTAVEPVDELRLPAQALHPSPRIEWIKDGLPELEVLRARGDSYDVIMMTAVWMHLDPDERRAGMRNLASLLRAGGTVLMMLRYGPVPEGRRMFQVTAEETAQLAGAHGLTLLLNEHRSSIKNHVQQKGVSWTYLAFRSGGMN